MRYYKKSTTIVSEDLVTPSNPYPKDLRFEQQEREVEDVSTISDFQSSVYTVAPGATVELPMAEITSATYLYLRSDGLFNIKLSNGPYMAVKPYKENELWFSFSSVTVNNPGSSPVRLTWAIGGL